MDFPDFPDYLRIPADVRRQAWIDNPPRPYPRFADKPKEEEAATRELRLSLEAQAERAKLSSLEKLKAWKANHRS